MTMEINGCWLFLVSIACLMGLIVATDDTDAFEVQCGLPVTAEVGDNVTLLCHTKPQRNVSDNRIEWLRGKDEVHLRRKGHDDFTDQNPVYKDRTSLSVYELSKGICSLKLSDVRESDNGKYRCAVKINEEEECYTNFTVLPRGKKTPPGDQHQDAAICPTEKPVLPRGKKTPPGDQHQDAAICPTEKPDVPDGDTDTSQMSGGAITGITAAVVAVISLFAFIGWKICPNPSAGQDRGQPGQGHELDQRAGNIPPDSGAGQGGEEPQEGDSLLEDSGAGQDGEEPQEEHEQALMEGQDRGECKKK